MVANMNDEIPSIGKAARKKHRNKTSLGQSYFQSG
jgi:hypothetical protein